MGKSKTLQRATPSLIPSRIEAPARPGGSNGRNRGSDHFTLELLQALQAFRSGDFSTRLPTGNTGIHGKIADAFNDVLAMSERRSREIERVCRLAGKEGRLRQRMVTTASWAGGPTTCRNSTR